MCLVQLFVLCPTIIDNLYVHHNSGFQSGTAKQNKKWVKCRKKKQL